MPWLGVCLFSEILVDATDSIPSCLEIGHERYESFIVAERETLCNTCYAAAASSCLMPVALLGLLQYDHGCLKASNFKDHLTCPSIPTDYYRYISTCITVQYQCLWCSNSPTSSPPWGSPFFSRFSSYGGFPLCGFILQGGSLGREDLKPQIGGESLVVILARRDGQIRGWIPHRVSVLLFPTSDSLKMCPVI